MTVEVIPAARYQAIDLRRRVRQEHGDVFAGYARAAYCSLHTTAGFLDPNLAARLGHRRGKVDAFMEAFRRLFPAGADYRHDQLHLRRELSEAQRRVEPRNADSHLAFIGSGLKSVVTHANVPEAPVYFLELDGVNEGVPRSRRARVLLFDREETVATETVAVPVSHHAIDAVNLADPGLGILAAAEDLLARNGVDRGRVDLALEGGENDSAVTVNEYETLLMRHDLREVLADPLRFVLQKGRSILSHPAAIPHRSLDYARYDLVIVLQRIIEAFGLSESALEKLLARAMALPASRLLRFRRSVSLMVSQTDAVAGGVVRGTYQSPILIQWRPAPSGWRSVRLTVRRFR